MVSESLINTIIGAGLAGAGLIFASYSIIISFSDKIKDFKDRRVEEVRQSINGTKPIEQLRESVDELERREATPFYLSQFVYGIFLLYLASSLFGIFYFTAKNPGSSLGDAAIWCFIIATVLFGVMGISLLQDFLEFLRETQKLKKTK